MYTPSLFISDGGGSCFGFESGTGGDGTVSLRWTDGVLFGRSWPVFVPELSSVSVSTVAWTRRPPFGEDGIGWAGLASSSLGIRFHPEYICMSRASLRLCSYALAFASLCINSSSSSLVFLNLSLLEADNTGSDAHNRSAA